MSGGGFKVGDRVELLRWLSKKQGFKVGTPHAGYLKKTRRIGKVVAVGQPTRFDLRCIEVVWDDGRQFRRERLYAIDELRRIDIVEQLGELGRAP